MSLKYLVPLSWTLWGVLTLLCLYGLFRVLTERSNSPESGRGLGVVAMVLVLAVMTGIGLCLSIAASRQSVSGVITILVILAWPVFLLVAQPAIRAYQKGALQRAEGRVGDFADETLQLFAAAIDREDLAGLRVALRGQPPPSGRDRAGHDLLAYAVLGITQGRVGVGPLRVLLEAGADPRRSRLPDGQPLLHALILSRYLAPEAGAQAMALLLQRGVDPNEIDPATDEYPLRRCGDQPDIVRLLIEHGANIDQVDFYGQPAVVHFTGIQSWESAIHLVEHGARLDIVSPSGVSLDYYLNTWRDGVHGQSSEGWDRLRAAIAQRRAASAP